MSVFTLEQINEIHDRLGRAESLGEFVRALAAIGVIRYDSCVTDGHSEYFDADGGMVATPPAHDTLAIRDDADGGAARRHLDRHAAAETNYFEMSKGLADSGVDRWTVDTAAMTMAFRDKRGRDLFVEKIS